MSLSGDVARTTVCAVCVGSISVYGHDLKSDISGIRREIGMGVCPQHDVLFPDMTVKEHLQFFAGIKGVDSVDVPRAVREAIATVGLTEKVRHVAFRGDNTSPRRGRLISMQ